MLDLDVYRTGGQAVLHGTKLYTIRAAGDSGDDEPVLRVIQHPPTLERVCDGVNHRLCGGRAAGGSRPGEDGAEIVRGVLQKAGYPV